jgi:hypothetical protein
MTHRVEPKVRLIGCCNEEDPLLQRKEIDEDRVQEAVGQLRAHGHVEANLSRPMQPVYHFGFETDLQACLQGKFPEKPRSAWEPPKKQEQEVRKSIERVATTFANRRAPESDIDDAFRYRHDGGGAPGMKEALKACAVHVTLPPKAPKSDVVLERKVPK